MAKTEANAEGGAVFSDCGRYRHILWRVWDPTLPRMVWAMLNPSKAGAPPQDDATVRRGRGFAKSWGYGRFDIGNLSDLIATDPRTMLAASFKELTQGTVFSYFWDALNHPATKLVVCAWGGNAAKSPHLGLRARALLKVIEDAGHVPHYLALTKSGHPAHPLRLPKALQPQPWHNQEFHY